MARLFDDASSQSLSVDAVPITAYPFTFGCWFNSDDTANAQVLLQIQDKDVNNHRFTLLLRGDLGGDPVRMTAQGGGTAASNDTTAGYTANTWYHALATGTSATARAVYLNGANSSTEATSVTPTGLDRTSIGARRDTSTGTYMSGLIAEAFVYNVVLGATDIAALAAGVCPLLVRPDALVFYAPLIGQYSPEIEVRGRNDLTLSNAPTAGVHPRIIYADGPLNLGNTVPASSFKAAWARNSNVIIQAGAA